LNTENEKGDTNFSSGFVISEAFSGTKSWLLEYPKPSLYYEYKGGLNFKANQHLVLTLGLGSYQTYKEGGDFVLPKNNDEIRCWPQVLLSQSIGGLKIEQRYRAEFRFTSSGYRNRFRYRPSLSYWFGKKQKEYKPFQAIVSNEIFFTDNPPYFERNRLLFAINYKPSSATTLQVGYLHQFDYKINDETGRNFFQIGCFIEIFRGNSSGATPNTNSKDQ
jgi:Protein of unknown function (DUF2490)